MELLFALLDNIPHGETTFSHSVNCKHYHDNDDCCTFVSVSATLNKQDVQSLRTNGTSRNEQVLSCLRDGASIAGSLLSERRW